MNRIGAAGFRWSDFGTTTGRTSQELRVLSPFLGPCRASVGELKWFAQENSGADLVWINSIVNTHKAALGKFLSNNGNGQNGK